VLPGGAPPAEEWSFSLNAVSISACPSDSVIRDSWISLTGAAVYMPIKD